MALCCASQEDLFSQVIASLPAARLAGAMMGGRGDLQDIMLVERLEWLREWLEATAYSDSDQQVSTSGCLVMSMQGYRFGGGS